MQMIGLLEIGSNFCFFALKNQQSHVCVWQGANRLPLPLSEIIHTDLADLLFLYQLDFSQLHIGL